MGRPSAERRRQGHLGEAPLTAVPRWRTGVGRRRAVRDLESLAVALEPCGWRLLRYYRREEFPVSLPLLRVHASGIERDVGLVLAVPAERQRRGVRASAWPTPGSSH